VLRGTIDCRLSWNVFILWPWSTVGSSAWEWVLHTDPSHILVVTLQRSQIISNYNTPDTAVRDRWQKLVNEMIQLLQLNIYTVLLTMTQADIDCEGHQWNIPVESNLHCDCFLTSDLLLDWWYKPTPSAACLWWALNSHTISHQYRPSHLKCRIYNILSRIPGSAIVFSFQLFASFRYCLFVFFYFRRPSIP